ncbi:MAG: TolC family protein [Candidatus Firestonebacteria bacterium]|nr:TolC family protein [Candidatus Firestonebacteria bacterium]
MKKFLLLYYIIACSFYAEELTLEKSISYAMSHNPKISAAKEKVRAANGNLTSAAANLYPQISASGVYSRSSGLTKLGLGPTVQLPVLGPTGVPTGDTVPMSSFSFTSDRIGDIYLAKLSLAWPVFTWGKIQGFVEIAESNRIIAEEDYNKTLQDVTYDIKSSFYALLMTQQMAKVLEETKKSLKAHVEVVQKRFEAGLASKFELLRAKVQLANVEPQLNRAENGFELALMGFNNALGAENNNKFTAVGEFRYEKESFKLEECLKEALQKRIELKQMNLRIKMSESALNIAVSACRPSIMLTANYSTSMGAAMPPSDTAWLNTWDAGAVLSIPIFDGFSASGKFEEAEGNLKQAKIGKEQLLDGIDIEVKGAFLTLEATEKTIVAQGENISMAKESLNMVKERYAQGLSTNLDVLDTEVSYLQTEISYYQSLYDQILAKEKLRKAIGRTGGDNVKK